VKNTSSAISWGFFDFFDVEIALHFAQDNLDFKKVLAPSKNPTKWLIMCFSRLKNIKSLSSKNSGTLIVNFNLLYYFFKNFLWRQAWSLNPLPEVFTLNEGRAVGFEPELVKLVALP
jgi:hypothetical protein